MPPPRIHLHLKLHRVQTDVPIGRADAHGEKTPSLSRTESEISKAESEIFEKWILRVWQEKDDMLEDYLTTGSFQAREPSNRGVMFRLPLRLKSPLEIVNAGALLGPGLILLGITKMVKSLSDPRQSL